MSYMMNDSAPNPIQTMLTSRVFPGAKYEFLRFQLGIVEYRTILDERIPAPVYRLLGFGSTEMKAANMAAAAFRKL